MTMDQPPKSPITEVDIDLTKLEGEDKKPSLPSDINLHQIAIRAGQELIEEEELKYRAQQEAAARIEKYTQKIAACKTFDELYYVLENDVQMIPSRVGNLSYEEVRNLIELVRQAKQNTKVIPSYCGLRKKVEDLLTYDPVYEQALMGKPNQDKSNSNPD